MAARLWVLLLLQPLPAISLQQIEQSLGAAAASVGFSEMECQMHTLALRFAKSRQPAMSSSAHRSLADALHLEQLCGTSPLPPPPQSSHTPQDTPAESEQRAASGAAVVYVATNGSDAAAGTQQLPFRSLLRARNALRSLRRVSDKSLPSRASAATVVLRGGKYFLNATLELTALDSWTTWRSFAGERVVLSGGLPLGSLDWQPAPHHPTGVLVAELGNTTDTLDPDFRQDMLAYNASDAGAPGPCCPPGNGCHTGCCPCPNRTHVWVRFCRRLSFRAPEPFNQASWAQPDRSVGGRRAHDPSASTRSSSTAPARSQRASRTATRRTSRGAASPRRTGRKRGTPPRRRLAAASRT